MSFGLAPEPRHLPRRGVHEGEEVGSAVAPIAEGQVGALCVGKPLGDQSFGDQAHQHVGVARAGGVKEVVEHRVVEQGVVGGRDQHRIGGSRMGGKLVETRQHTEARRVLGGQQPHPGLGNQLGDLGHAGHQIRGVARDQNRTDALMRA